MEWKLLADESPCCEVCKNYWDFYIQILCSLNREHSRIEAQNAKFKKALKEKLIQGEFEEKEKLNEFDARVSLEKSVSDWKRNIRWLQEGAIAQDRRQEVKLLHAHVSKAAKEINQRKKLLEAEKEMKDFETEKAEVEKKKAAEELKSVEGENCKEDEKKLQKILEVVEIYVKKVDFRRKEDEVGKRKAAEALKGAEEAEKRHKKFELDNSFKNDSAAFLSEVALLFSEELKHGQAGVVLLTTNSGDATGATGTGMSPIPGNASLVGCATSSLTFNGKLSEQEPFADGAAKLLLENRCCKERRGKLDALSQSILLLGGNVIKIQVENADLKKAYEEQLIQVKREKDERLKESANVASFENVVFLLKSEISSLLQTAVEDLNREVKVIQSRASDVEKEINQLKELLGKH